MARAPKLNPADIPKVRQMVVDGLNDKQIGERLGASGLTVWKFRKAHGIASNRRLKRGNPAWGQMKRTAEPSVPLGEITTYTDEQGRKITKYPPGYAIGVEAEATAKGNSRY